MTFLNTSLIRKSILFFVAAILSVSAMAADFNQTQQLANQGNSDAQHLLGLTYFKGEDLRQDYDKAFKWFNKAANQGNADAQNRLGNIYSRSTLKQIQCYWDEFYAASNSDAVAQQASKQRKFIPVARRKSGTLFI